MTRPPPAKKISPWSNAAAARRERPYLSTTPWAGFSKHDRARDEPLTACPSPRCRRARACLAAHDGLYCRRTHFSPAEIAAMQADSELARALAALPEAADADDLSGRLERMTRLAEIRRAHHEEMTARWKAGEFDHLYGKYRPQGVLMKPPPRTYVETGPRA